MFFLIADSGSTKTDWVLLSSNGIEKEVKTIGFNPYFQTREAIKEELSRVLLPAIKNDIKNISKIIYYGAGCSNDENCDLIENSIRGVIPVKEISVNHDLLAAARALCGNERGIACILGTGSNSCLYDGKDVIENVPSVGYMFGDFGSGACIGKQIVQNYFNRIMPQELVDAFEAEGYHREMILVNIYKRSMPSRFLASISTFVAKHSSHPYMNEILEYCFEGFYSSQVSQYTNATKYQVHFVGSIGYYYQDVLKHVTKRLGYQMGKVIQSPIEGLIAYHQQQIKQEL
jgi:glucosamine kinase